MNLNQSLQEVNRIFEEWKNNFVPKDLLLEGEQAKPNVNALVEYVALHFGGIVSITNLDAALAALRPNLQYAPKKSQEQLSAEFRAKEMKRRLAEEAANKVDAVARINKANEDKKAKDKKEQDQAMARNTIEAVISGYQCYRGPNRVDYALTEQRQKYLRGIVAANLNADQIKVLALIRRKILEFPEPNERSRQ